MMNPDVQTALTITLPTIAVLMGILQNNRSLDSFRREMDAKFEGIGYRFDALVTRIDALTERVGKVEDRVKRLEDAILGPTPLVKR